MTATSPSRDAHSQSKPPVTVWVLGLLLGAMAFVSVIGSFVFSFPLGGALGYTTGTLILAAGVGYGVIVWRLRRGEPAVWTAALLLPIVHQGGLLVLDLVLYGTVPEHDYPFIGVTLTIVTLLLLPPTRRFFGRA